MHIIHRKHPDPIQTRMFMHTNVSTVRGTRNNLRNRQVINPLQAKSIVITWNKTKSLPAVCPYICLGRSLKLPNGFLSIDRVIQEEAFYLHYFYIYILVSA
jgi:hypothetical protein